jgi:hypothetical protein
MTYYLLVEREFSLNPSKNTNYREKSEKNAITFLQGV